MEREKERGIEEEEEGGKGGRKEGRKKEGGRIDGWLASSQPGRSTS